MSVESFEKTYKSQSPVPSDGLIPNRVFEEAFAGNFDYEVRDLNAIKFRLAEFYRWSTGPLGESCGRCVDCLRAKRFFTRTSRLQWPQCAVLPAVQRRASRVRLYDFDGGEVCVYDGGDVCVYVYDGDFYDGCDGGDACVFQRRGGDRVWRLERRAMQKTPSYWQY